MAESMGTMSREQTRNIETFKVGAARVNQFERNRQQSETKQFPRCSNKAVADKPLTKAEQVAKLMRNAHRRAERRNKNDSSSD